MEFLRPLHAFYYESLALYALNEGTVCSLPHSNVETFFIFSSYSFVLNNSGVIFSPDITLNNPAAAFLVFESFLLKP